MDEASLLRFLLEANRRGYAAGQSAVRTRESDHSTTIGIGGLVDRRSGD